MDFDECLMKTATLSAISHIGDFRRSGIFCSQLMITVIKNQRKTSGEDMTVVDTCAVGSSHFLITYNICLFNCYTVIYGYDD